MRDSAEIKELAGFYRLDYHVSMLEAADREIGLRGKRVLEIGGSLPEGLVCGTFGATQWVSVCKHDDVRQDRAYGSDSPLENASRRPQELPQWCAYEGDAADLPEIFNSQFDAAISVACFEHVTNMVPVLRAVHRCLRVGGLFYIMASPVWTSSVGHHIWDVDYGGRKYHFGCEMLPPWAHLLLRPMQMWAYVASKYDEKAADQVIWQVYHDPGINRYTPRDYAEFFINSPFTVHKLFLTFARHEMTDEIAQGLAKRFDELQHCKCETLVAVLRKDR